MSRPENVKCETCCYWDDSLTKAEDGTQERKDQLNYGWTGECHRFPPSLLLGPHMKQYEKESGNVAHGDTPHWYYCGEWRAEWPASENA